MLTRNIIVIGASAGGFEALQQVVEGFRPDFPAAIFVVWHMSPEVRGMLPLVLNRANTLKAAHAYDGEAIVSGRIYVAKPDHHLLIEPGIVRVARGPKEHRFRPAIDPLFRSAAYAYGPQVIGVVLSGALDDGTAGLWTIKYRGGLAVIQDPADAEVPSMPESARREVTVDHSVPVADMANLLMQISQEPTQHVPQQDTLYDVQTQREISIAKESRAFELGIMKFGDPTPYTCPECHGALSTLKDGHYLRFRCHTGHAFSPSSLLAAVSETIEESIWNSIRALEEGILLLNNMGDHYAEANSPKLAARYFQQAQAISERARVLHAMISSGESLSSGRFREEVGTETTEDE
jgi:two-component system, chemotaxis family, protein-glutamate methylesterase/glutaminase